MKSLSTSLSKFFLPLLAVLALIGAGCMQYASQSKLAAEFGQSVAMESGSVARFDDGLTVTLANINDSRCPANVQCIWAGEIAATLQIKGGKVGSTPRALQLGTVVSTERALSGYVFLLASASPTSITLKVTKSAAVSASPEQPAQPVVPEVVVSGRVAINGTFACLPHKNTSGPVTLECAFGLRSDEGFYYALDTSVLKSNAFLALTTGSRIAVKGTLTTAENMDKNSQLQKYAIIGVIKVTSVETLK